jgi:probable 2-oxoglutarate dehydrogenase E1 component DHKTD1
VSQISEFTNPSYFKPVLSDSSVISESNVKTVIFCSGKHFYTLSKERDEKNLTNIAIIRLEELCPFPAKEISAELLKFKSAKGIFII